MLSFGFFLGGPGSAAADCVRPDAVDLAVGIREAAPFVTSDPVRGTRGLSVDLWEEVAEDLARDGIPARFAYVNCPLGEQLAALETGALDLVISPLTITAERMESFDFSVQYLASGLTAAQRHTATIDFEEATRTLQQTLMQPGFARAALVFLVVNLVLAFLIWLVLRRSDEVTGEVRGLGSALLYVFEAIGRTIGLKGLGDGYRSVIAKTLEMVMAVIGTVLSATVFGVLTTVFISAIGSETSIPARNLADLRVVTLVNSTAEDFIRAVHLDRDPEANADFRCVPLEGAADDAACVTVAAWDVALRAMLSGQADVVVGDWAQLIYLSRQPRFADVVSVQQEIYLAEPYGWGLSRATIAEGGMAKADLRRAIDQQLIERMRSPFWRVMVQDYIGIGSISPQ